MSFQCKTRGTNPGIVAEEGQEPLKFIVSIVGISLNAREDTEHDNIQSKRRGETKRKIKQIIWET